MDNIDMKPYLMALRDELKGINSRLDVINRKIDEIDKNVKENNKKITSENNSKADTRENTIKRDNRNRVIGMNPEDFYNLRKQGYSLNQIAYKTGWSKSKVQLAIREYKKQRGEK